MFEPCLRTPRIFEWEENGWAQHHLRDWKSRNEHGKNMEITQRNRNFYITIMPSCNFHPVIVLTFIAPQRFSIFFASVMNKNDNSFFLYEYFIHIDV